MVFFTAREESEPDAIHAAVCVIFKHTHPESNFEKNNNTKTSTVILVQLVESQNLGQFPVSLNTADVANVNMQSL